MGKNTAFNTNRSTALMAPLLTLLIGAASASFNANAAPAMLIENVDTKQTIQSKNADKPKKIMSLTKIMTASLIQDAIDARVINANEIITIPKKINQFINKYSTRKGVKDIEVVTIKDALHGMLIDSNNQLALALALHTATKEGITHSQFIADMNKKAKDLGMGNTNFTSMSGLSYNGSNTSTMQDMAKLMRHIHDQQNELFQIMSTKKHTANIRLRGHKKDSSITFTNTSALTKYSQIFPDAQIACKTGSGKGRHSRICYIDGPQNDYIVSLFEHSSWTRKANTNKAVERAFNDSKQLSQEQIVANLDL